MIKLLVFLVSLSAWANWDIYGNGAFRLFPLGAFSAMQLGYGQKIWGKTTKADGSFNPMYGFIRPSIKFRTSLIVNATSVELDFNPISFVKFNMGQEYMSRQITNIGTFNCPETEICRGYLGRTYYGVKMALAHKNFFSLFGAKLTRIRMFEQLGQFADERGTLVVRSHHDWIQKYQMIAGYNLNPKWAVAGAFIKQHTKYTNQSTVMSFALLRRKYKKWSYSAGPGNFHTRNNTNHFSFVFLVDWNVKKGLPLFY